MPDEKDLEKLRAAYKKLQDNIAVLQQQAAGAHAELMATEALIAEIGKASANYDGPATSMQEEVDAYHAAIGKKRQIAELKVKDLKDTLDKKITEFDTGLQNQEKAVGAAADTAAKASAASDKAAQALRDKQSAFTALKDQAKTIGVRLNEIKTLLADVAKAEARGDDIAMYFYVTEAAAKVKDVHIPTSDEHKKHLLEAQSAVEGAKTAAAAKKADSDKAAADAVDAKRKHETALASRRTDLLKALHDVKAPPKHREPGYKAGAHE